MDKWYLIENTENFKFLCVTKEGKITTSFWHNPKKTYEINSTLLETINNFEKWGFLVTELGYLEDVEERHYAALLVPSTSEQLKMQMSIVFADSLCDMTPSLSKSQCGTNCCTPIENVKVSYNIEDYFVMAILFFILTYALYFILSSLVL